MSSSDKLQSRCRISRGRCGSTCFRKRVRFPDRFGCICRCRRCSSRRLCSRCRILLRSNMRIIDCPVISDPYCLGERTKVRRRYKDARKGGRGDGTFILSLVLVSLPPTKGGLVPFIATIIVELSEFAKTCPLRPFSSHPKSVDSFHLWPTSYQSSVSGIRIYAFEATLANVSTECLFVVLGRSISRVIHSAAGDWRGDVDRELSREDWTRRRERRR